MSQSPGGYGTPLSPQIATRTTSHVAIHNRFIHSIMQASAMTQKVAMAGSSLTVSTPQCVSRAQTRTPCACIAASTQRSGRRRTLARWPILRRRRHALSLERQQFDVVDLRPVVLLAAQLMGAGATLQEEEQHQQHDPGQQDQED